MKSSCFVFPDWEPWQVLYQRQGSFDYLVFTFGRLIRLPYVQEGDNALELRVVNSLTNRMIGDASLPQEERYTYAYPEIVKAGDRLVPSGIIGEVLLVRR